MKTSESGQSVTDEDRFSKKVDKERHKMLLSYGSKCRENRCGWMDVWM